MNAAGTSDLTQRGYGSQREEGRGLQGQAAEPSTLCPLTPLSIPRIGPFAITQGNPKSEARPPSFTFDSTTSGILIGILHIKCN